MILGNIPDASNPEEAAALHMKHQTLGAQEGISRPQRVLSQLGSIPLLLQAKCHGFPKQEIQPLKAQSNFCMGMYAIGPRRSSGHAPSSSPHPLRNEGSQRLSTLVLTNQ
ncbi:hypothetical protein NHX12_031104 [Muraenolepis orangiensis]|uniref:Uncharacterized protein n=1 Tax=Muraenolepis orangiensis TaxID=630683 RepID=A0A9Q0EFA3_9TELE|nr:hypothetical protein NHX12_031104 [Muraenolepis orangiensis]